MKLLIVEFYKMEWWMYNYFILLVGDTSPLSRELIFRRGVNHILARQGHVALRNLIAT